MTTPVAAMTNAKLGVDGKRMVAEGQYKRGKSFVGAAILLRQNGGCEFVVLYLLLQGIENVLKGLLLYIDYETYKPMLKKSIGHNLLKLTAEAAEAAGLSPLRPALRDEVDSLNTLYSKHILRYSSTYDIFVNPSTIQSRRVFYRIGALLRLVERKGLVGGCYAI